MGRLLHVLVRDAVGTPSPHSRRGFSAAAAACVEGGKGFPIDHQSRAKQRDPKRQENFTSAVAPARSMIIDGSLTSRR